METEVIKKVFAIDQSTNHSSLNYKENTLPQYPLWKLSQLYRQHPELL